MPSPPDPAVRELLDKQAITEVVMRYCRGNDRLDRELVRSCYHPGATDEHGSFHGAADEFVAWVFRLLERFDVTQHLVANVLIELEGDAARCESYGMAVHARDGGAPEHNLLVGFRYVDRFERREPGGWRIAHRVVAPPWARRTPPEQVWPIPEGQRTGKRDASDPVYDPL